MSEVELRLVDSLDAAVEFRAWIDKVRSRSDVLAVDTEGTGLDHAVDRVRTVQFGDALTGWTVPLGGWRALVTDTIASWRGLWVMHNAKHDVGALEQAEGITIPRHRVHDTRLAGYVLHPLHSTALKNNAVKYVDRRSAAMQEQLHDTLSRYGYDWATMPIVAEGPLSVYWIYAALDPVYTYRLWQMFDAQMDAQDRAAYDLELSSLWPAVDMQRRGIRVDIEYASELDDRYGQKMLDLSSEVTGRWGISPGSRDGVVEVLRRDGHPMTSRTGSGMVCVDKAALSGIDHPLARILLERRKIEKIRSTFVRGMLTHGARDGRVHPNINTIGGPPDGGGYGTRTSRMSMSGPNFQQLPKGGGEYSTPVRECVTATDVDHVLLSSDFAQVEMRIMAHVSGDKGLARAFASPDDFFVSLGRRLFDDPSMTREDPRRTLVKGAAYAKIFCAGPQTFASTAGIELSHAAGIYRQFDKLFPGVSGVQRTTAADAVSGRRRDPSAPYARSVLTGRRLECDDEALYRLVNYRIQSTGAEILKTKILQLCAAGLGDYLVLPVHDEIILDVPLSELEESAATVHAIMNDDDLLSVPLTASMQIGPRWGSMTSYEMTSETSKR